MEEGGFVRFICPTIAKLKKNILAPHSEKKSIGVLFTTTHQVARTKSLLIVYSYHHNNTQKVAEVMAKVLDAEIKTPQQTNPEELQNYELVGFGSGIDTGKNYPELLDFASKLPQVANKKAFVFSTSGMPVGVSGQQKVEEYTSKCHTALKETLQSKGYTIVDEFGCAGFNTNKFLKYFGGINKGRPNEEDLKHAEAFAEKLKV